MATEKGYCRFCQQGIIVTVHTKPNEKPTDGALNEAATEKCNCEGAKRDRANKKAIENIPKLFGESCPVELGGPIDKKHHPWLIETAILVATEKIEAVTLKLGPNITAVFKSDKGLLKIKRKRSREYEVTF
jgi:hypothetical protein